jgi:HEAT repeat protein
MDAWKSETSVFETLSSALAVVVAVICLLPVAPRGWAQETISAERAAQTKRLTDRDPSVRAAAAANLGQLSILATGSAPALVAALAKDTNPVVRSAAAQALGDIGPLPKESAPALVAALAKDTNPDVRSAAAQALRSFGERANETTPALLAALAKDRAAEVRGAAAQALGQFVMDPKEVIPPLIAALAKDGNAAVRSAAAQALGQIGINAKEAAPALISALKDSDAGVRGFAAVALGQIGLNTREVIVPLIATLNDPNATVRSHAADALAAIAGAARDAKQIEMSEDLDQIAQTLDADGFKVQAQKVQTAVNLLRALQPYWYLHHLYNEAANHPLLTLVPASCLLGALCLVFLRRRRLNTERIVRERNEKYPLWEERIDREFVGEPSVKLTFVPKRHRDYTIVEYRSRRKDLEFVSREDAIISENESQINAFKTAWSAADGAILKKSREEFAQATAQLSDLLCDRLGFRRLEASRYHDEKQAFKINAPGLSINVPSNLVLIFLESRNHDVESVRAMVNLVRLLGLESRYFGAAVTFFSSDRLRQAIQDSGAYRSEFVVLDRKSVWEILAKTAPVRRFTQQILSQVDLMAVSPFELAGPVSDRMFYGRIEEEKTLTRSITDNNFALVANRKIGKTSLLERVSRILSQDPDFQVLTFDLQRAEPNYIGFFRLLSTCEPFRRHAGLLGDPKPMDFYEITAAVSNEAPSRRLVLIFDEVDDLLLFDQENKTQLFKTARALSQKKICRFIFVGSKILARSLTDPEGPFFNFCTALRLGCLDRAHAEKLVTVPFQEMGITIEDQPRVVDRLLDVSSAHPNILQYACHQLLRRVNQKNVRTISLPDVEDIVESEDFYQYFTGVVWGQADSYERLVIYVMMNSGQSSFKIEDIAAELDKRGISRNRLKSTAEVLSLYSLLSQLNGRLSLTFSYLTQASHRRENLESVIEELSEGVRSSRD